MTFKMNWRKTHSSAKIVSGEFSIIGPFWISWYMKMECRRNILVDSSWLRKTFFMKILTMIHLLQIVFWYSHSNKNCESFKINTKIYFSDSSRNFKSSFANKLIIRKHKINKKSANLNSYTFQNWICAIKHIAYVT